ncbi:hypothetical protein Taro_035225, partial [Colocasia esculenta]|nr:hypothetical protein [Colocasia esculenta]
DLNVLFFLLGSGRAPWKRRRGNMRMVLEHLRRRRPAGRPHASVLGAIRCCSSRDGAGTPRASAVLSFGDNSMAALGLPFPLREAYEPTRVPSLPCHISSIAAGHYHSLAVTSSGEVWAWGRNDEGQLGRGFSTPRDAWHEPRKVEGLDDVKIRSAFASGVVSAAIGVDGSLWVWGKSRRGQLGLGSGTVEAVKPSKVKALEGEEIIKVSFGWGHALALTSGGKLFGWGYTADGRLGRMGESLNISSMLHARLNQSTMAGNNLSPLEVVEKLINDKMEKEKHMPIIWEPTAVEELDSVEVSDVACGLDHSLVLCCKRDFFPPYLAYYNFSSVVTPMTRMNMHFSKDSSPPCCNLYASLSKLIILGDGMTLSCGNNIYGELGRTGEGCKMLPVEMPFLPVSLSAGLGHSLAVCRISSDESAVHATRIASWGWNQSSQLGRQGEEDRPGIVEGLDGQRPVSVSGGRAHSIAVTSGGEVWVWGSGANGRLGLGSSIAEPEATPLESVAGLEVLQAACGFDHNLLLVAE